MCGPPGVSVFAGDRPTETGLRAVQGKALFEAGEVGAAIEELTRAVQADPTDAAGRTFLFELLCFAGEWDRAEKQLDVIGQQTVQAEVGVQVYRNNIRAERDRRRVFSEGLHPHMLIAPPAYVVLHLAAINRLREGNAANARQALDRAEEERPALAGRLNDKPFEDFRDSNDMVGPVLELIVRDRYTLLPFEQITWMEIAPPKRLRDLMWATVQLEASDGTVGGGYVPALYVGSAEHQNELVKLGRMTDWKPLGADLYAAVGLRLFVVDGEDRPVFEARRVEFDAGGA